MPYTGSGVLGSALGMDKYRCKLAWAGCGLPTAASVLLRTEADLARRGARLPAHDQAGPRGLEHRDGAGRGPAALADAWRPAAVTTPWSSPSAGFRAPSTPAPSSGRRRCPMIRLETPHAFYDFEAKYRADSTRYHCPCGLPEAEESRLQRLALDAFEATGASGWGRVDLMVDGSGEPFLLEINTVPGMTDHSLVPMAARVAGLDFDTLVLRILETSLDRG
jgi:D-alanine-D-alanine ligase